MSLCRFTVSGFRCFERAEIEPDARLNLITGANASGKTSLLESIFYLGRGRSFRASANTELVRAGGDNFTLFGETEESGTRRKAGIEVSRSGRRLRVDNETGNSADLARFLPVHVIDPEIHELVRGGPEERRRFLDWGVFHVKHQYLESWRQYQKALRQRNAALRHGEPENRVRLWDASLALHGEAVNTSRQAFLEEFLPRFVSIIAENLNFDAKCEYKRGWSPNSDFSESLERSFARDRALGSTQVGPHRADLLLQVDTRRARHRVSRGQQKMLAAALVIAQTRFLAEHTDASLVLLVDDPAAELDRDNRERLFNMLQQMPVQMFVTALEAEDLPWSAEGQMFHVDHGKVISLL